MFCPNPECPDLVEGGVRGEYISGIKTCPVCGATLVETIDDAEPEDLIDENIEVESVFVTADHTEAAVVRSLLEASGIPFSTTGAADQDYLGLGSAGVGVVGPGGVEFLVRADDADAARAILAEHDFPEMDDDEEDDEDDD